MNKEENVEREKRKKDRVLLVSLSCHHVHWLISPIISYDQPAHISPHQDDQKIRLVRHHRRTVKCQYIIQTRTNRLIGIVIVH